MEFISEAKKKPKLSLKVGDMFDDFDGTMYLVVQPLVIRDYHYRNEGYTYVNLTCNSLAYPKFDTLIELQERLIEEELILNVYDGKSIVVNLGVPTYTVEGE
jgi:hypothetical protein